MGKENTKRRNAHHAENMARKRDNSQKCTNKISANASPELPESNSQLPAWEKSLDPVYPDPDKNFEPLSPYLVESITKATIEEMKRLAQERHISLDWKYWEKTTRSILGQPNTDIAIICPSPAGSGKSTWILAFLLTIKSLFFSSSELESALVGITVVLQKVEDLNCLAEALNQNCAPGAPFMVPLQGWNASGKKRGFCRNSGVENYADCPRARCPYAAQCPILTFLEKASYAPLVGLTQERFYILREGNLSPILQRTGPDGHSHPRRYIIFDEKFRMAPVAALSAAQINEASTELNSAIQKYGVMDSQVRILQQRLDYAVLRPFQNIRKAQRTEATPDIPVGFLYLPMEDEDRQAYKEFKTSVINEKGRFMSKPLSAVFSVMDYIYDGGTALFTKTNGFCIYRIDPPQLHFGDCQTIVFDATAEVDNDYRYLDGIEILSGMPGSRSRTINIYIHTDRALNVSKNAMEKPWKLPAFAEYIAELIKSSNRPVFLCTYQKVAVELADRLQELLSKADFSRVLLMPDREPPMLPYFNGTNGSNQFKDAELVIILGYPRLDPSTYLAFACAAYGSERISAELDKVPEEVLLGRSFNPLDLPSVHEYVSHHLAARLEQEIYRCAQRNPEFTGEINIHLFCPMEDVLNILRERIPGKIVFDDTLPECFARWKGAMRRYDDGKTSLGRLMQFLDEWDGIPLYIPEIRESLGISSAIWKDLMADTRVKASLEQRSVQRTGRGPNAKWAIPGKLCA